MKDSLGSREYGVADRKTGKLVSRLVPTYEAANELLNTVYLHSRDDLTICGFDLGEGGPSVPNIPGQGDNSPG